MVNSPLTKVIAQVRFPPILSIQKPDIVADFQEALRTDYPLLQRNDVRNIEIAPDVEPRISEVVVWRLSNRSDSATWRVSLGTDFVALETSRYVSRDDFLVRLRSVLSSTEECFHPAEAQRVGLRYIDRLEGEAVQRIDELIHPSVLGILQLDEDSVDMLGTATAHMMTQAQFIAVEGIIQGRWGSVPPNSTYDPDALHPIGESSWVLDLDMSSPHTLPFASDELIGVTSAFAKRTYSVFRMMVNDAFLSFYGGSP